MRTSVKLPFWVLGPPASLKRLAQWRSDEMDMETVVCPENSGHQRPGKRLTDLSVKLPGSDVQDIVWTWYTECLLTDFAMMSFRQAGFTGFDVRPVKAAFARAKKNPPQLWELVVTGWGGIAPPESGVKLVKECRACGATQYTCPTDTSRLVDHSRWDGSDFFIVWPLPRYICVTDRVAEAVRENGLKGCVLTRPEDLDFGGGNCSPGRLSYWMPPKRARELGEELGIY
jgi:hypothetical protein